MAPRAELSADTEFGGAADICPGQFVERRGADDSRRDAAGYLQPERRGIVYGGTIEHGIGRHGVPIRSGGLGRVALAQNSAPRVICSDSAAARIPCVWAGSFIAYWREEDYSA